MKKLLVLIALCGLASCSSSKSVASQSCVIEGCGILAVHSHTSVYWNGY